MTNQLINIAELLEELTPLAKEIEKRKAEASDIGFNVFQIASDTYYRENFHSYILYNLLNPEYHDEGKLFLNLLIDCLNECGQVKIEKNDFQNPVVERESDRVDIRIRDKVSRKSILIENKINDACDQSRQIPRYFNIETDADFEVTGIVYLTFLNGKTVSTEAWTAPEIKFILPKIVYLSAVGVNEVNLIDNWLNKCILLSKHEDVPAILRQYKNIIKYLSKQHMDQDLLEQFYQHTQDEEKFQTAMQISKMLPNLCKHRADRIMKYFKHSTKLFNSKSVFEHQKVWRAKFEKGILPQLKWIDIACEEDRTDIIFESNEKTNPDAFYSFLKTIGAGENFREYAPFVLIKEFKYPSQEEELYNYLNNLFATLETIGQGEFVISK